MFTGIVESTGKVVDIKKDKGNIHFTIQTSITKELQIDQSMSHDGVCLTVVKIDKTLNQYVVTAIQETLNKTNLGTWHIGYEVNLERSMKMDGRFDGHIVQGHIDGTATCTSVEETDGSWKYFFKLSNNFNDNDSTGLLTSDNITVKKGSISVNGVSLTVVDSEKDTFSVAIIPFTYEVTNFHNFKVGTTVNIEFDIFGKYIAKLLKQYLVKEL